MSAQVGLIEGVKTSWSRPVGVTRESPFWVLRSFLWFVRALVIGDRVVAISMAVRVGSEVEEGAWVVAEEAVEIEVGLTVRFEAGTETWAAVSV